MCVCDRVKRPGRVEGCVCLWLVGVMGGWGTCIIDLLLWASCTLDGIKMIHGLFLRLIPVILRYQTSVFCPWQWGAHTHASTTRTHTHDKSREFFLGS